MPSQRLTDRIALITGGSRGIGRAVALAFAREGAHVVLVARNVGALEETDDAVRAAGGSATLVPLDLADGDKIDNLGPTLYQRWGRLDVLVGNAGILGPLSPLSHISAEDWERVLRINLTANWRLIRAMDPLLRAAPAGRGIFVTSGAADGHHAYWGPYAVSKAGLETLVKTYAQEVASTPVRVNLVNPGATATRMRAQAFPGEKPETLPQPDEIAEQFVPLALAACRDNGVVFQPRRR